MSTGRSSAQRGQRRAMERQAEAQEQANKLAQERLEWQQEQMQTYEDRYGGLEQQTLQDALRGAQGDYEGVTGRAASDVAQQFGAQRDEQRRQMAAHGLDPTSGRYQSADRAAGMEQASASALAQNQARMGERQRVDQLDQQRRQEAQQFGQARFGAASQGVDNAFMGLQQSRSQEAGMHGQQASQYGQMAQEAGQFAGGIGQLVGTVGGAVLGGPAGGAIGGAIGGMFGGGDSGGASLPSGLSNFGQPQVMQQPQQPYQSASPYNHQMAQQGGLNPRAYTGS